jgi:hypothetical protein
MFHVRPVLVMAAVFALASCGGKKDEPAAGSSAPTPVAKPAPVPAPVPVTPTPAERPPTTESAAGPTTPSVADAPAGTPPPDGKYERVRVDGVTVPMINVTEGGTVVLVDTDGKKPRTWEEQYKRKKAKLAGQFDIHKTDANKNGKFDDDAIDKEGLWLIDTQGNITKH